MVTAQDLQLDGGNVDDLAFNLRAVREEAEKRLITRVLAYTDANISRSAELLGVTRPTLYALMDKYAIIEERSRRQNVTG